MHHDHNCLTNDIKDFCVEYLRNLNRLINEVSFSPSTACIPARYILSVLSSIGMAIIYGLKVNLSVAMVAMVNHTAVGGGDHGGHGSDATNLDSGVEVCEAEPVANGTVAGDLVC